MRIGELAKKAGVNVQTLRYYERRGLLRPARRAPSGFREYEAAALLQVRFIRRAQRLGFTLDEINGLLALWVDSSKSCSAVETRARTTLQRIDANIADLGHMRDALAKYVLACSQRARMQQCPLLEDLGGSGIEKRKRPTAH